MKESIQTFSDPDGSSKKGDIIVTSKEEALKKLKGFIEASKSKTKNAKKNAKWDFRSCPNEQFNKTLDDTFMCFIKWARVKDDGRTDNQSDDEYNVSKVSRTERGYNYLFDLTVFCQYKAFSTLFYFFRHSGESKAMLNGWKNLRKSWWIHL